ncbi:MAG TPA: Crp/Fnr family transcriptional regulator [Vicinamibacterales bacterium]|nr:Crp/Fnr family transcriptional regulator [Vicinamibacterales bacterium]
MVKESASAFDVLRAYLRARASFSDQEMDFIRTMFRPATLLAGEFLQRAGTVAKDAAFVAKGCLRSYVIDAKGKEHIVLFAPETWWVADNVSLTSGRPSDYFIDAIEDSDLLLIDSPSHEAVVEKVPGYASGHRKGLQRRTAAQNERIVSSISASAHDRYLRFLETYPSLATRVPQSMVASYLGVTPETVSRIRRKLARK